MKRNILISALALSTIILLFIAIIPHHHHADMTCLVFEYCEQDRTINDEHTNHSESTDNSNHNKSCIGEFEFITPQFNDEINSKSFSDNNYKNFFPLFFLTADLFNLASEISFSEQDYEKHILNYNSEELSRIHGLRAPPITFS